MGRGVGRSSRRKRGGRTTVGVAGTGAGKLLSLFLTVRLLIFGIQCEGFTEGVRLGLWVLYAVQ